MIKVKCSSCGFQNDNIAKYCKKCGSELTVATKKYCNNCGKELNNHAKFCKHCGAGVIEGPSGYSKSDNITKRDNIRYQKRFTPVLGVIVLLLVVLILGAGSICFKRQKDNNLKNSNSTEVNNEIDRYNDTSEELLSENDNEERIIPEENIIPSQSNNDKRTIYSQSIEVEEIVLVIREKYNEIVNSISSNLYEKYNIEEGIIAYYYEDELKAVIVEKDKNDIEYTQSYYYDQNDLMFAYYENEDSHRFYFYEGYLMRWRYCADADNPSDAINYDWDEFDEYIEWENTVLTNSNLYK